MTHPQTQGKCADPDLRSSAASERVTAPGDSGLPARGFDGVICFGDSDWWYHNRGHYDMQMMRELSVRVPALYVNSLGLRMPRVAEGRMFLHRVLRKLASFGRGLVRVRENFSVFSPIVAPGRVGAALTRPLLAPQVRLAARRVGIRRPLVWVACPPAAAIVDRLRAVAVVYQRTDALEYFPGADVEALRRLDRAIKQRADLTIFCSSYLFERERGECRRAAFVDHGVDYERFADAGKRNAAPADVAGLPRPRVGFVGGIDSHTFDAALFVEVARRLSDVQFVLVGACSLPEGWCPLPNVALLGKRPYEQVADYMAACDVLIMPWNRNDWIRACNPVKLKEYLAVGRPVVSTPFDELRNYAGHVQVAGSAEMFAGAIRTALAAPSDPAPRRARVAAETWAAKAAACVGLLDDERVRHVAG